MGFLSKERLDELGFNSIGENVLISDKCSVYGRNMSIGNNVRIDDFCILSGNITIGNNIHIGAYCALYGGHGIIMENYTGLSPRCTIFSASDDFSGNYMISPMNPKEFTNVTGAPVVLKKFVQIGSGTVIMPGVILNEGSAVGAMSFVKKCVSEWEIWAGNPLCLIKERSKKIIELEKQLMSDVL